MQSSDNHRSIDVKCKYVKKNDIETRLINTSEKQDRFGATMAAASASHAKWIEMLSHFSTLLPVEERNPFYASSSSAFIMHIHDEIRKFEARLEKLAEAISAKQFAEADNLASTLGFASKTLQNFLLEQVDSLRLQLACCESTPNPIVVEGIKAKEVIQISGTTILFCIFCGLLFKAFWPAHQKQKIKKFHSTTTTR
jgi:hypothetical protein